MLQKVGADGTRARVNRLTVSGCWYKCAQEVLLRDIKLSAKALNEFPPKSDRTRGLLRRYMMQLRICLADFLESDEILFPGNGLPKSLLDEIRHRLGLEVWLNNRFRDVSTFLTGYKNLKKFHSQGTARPLDGEWFLPPLQNCIYESSISSLLGQPTCHTLTDLYLDTTGTVLDYTRFWQEDTRSTRLCLRLARHIPNLHRFHVHLLRICPRMLSLRNYTGSVALQVLVVKLSSQRICRDGLSVNLSRSCGQEDQSLPYYARLWSTLSKH